MQPRKLVNQTAVRDAFHDRNVRLPRGFFDDLEQCVYAAFRKIADGEVDVDEQPNEAEGQYVRRVSVKEALRSVLGKTRVESGWVTYLNGIVAEKVGRAVTSESASVPMSLTVPSPIIRAFMKSKESQTMTLDQFFRKWNNYPEFRDGWTKQAEHLRLEPVLED